MSSRHKNHCGMHNVLLSRTTTVGGCCGKIPVETLRKIVGQISYAGADCCVDCAVVDIAGNLCAVSSVDVMLPPVADATLFGKIAACNALSDIYTMGVLPSICLAVLGLPDGDDVVAAEAIQAGGAEIIQRSGSALLGGHTLRNPEYLYGLSVTAIAPKDELWNKPVNVGDYIILTKPIGSGVALSALKNGFITEEYARDVITSVTMLNDAPVKALNGLDIHEATDISGYGLLGHLCNLAKRSGVMLEIEFDKLPFFPIALDLYGKRQHTALTASNLEAFVDDTKFQRKLSDVQMQLLGDPQTNGALAIVIPQTLLAEAETRLCQATVPYVVIGRVASTVNNSLLNII